MALDFVSESKKQPGAPIATHYVCDMDHIMSKLNSVIDVVHSTITILISIDLPTTHVQTTSSKKLLLIYIVK